MQIIEANSTPDISADAKIQLASIDATFCLVTRANNLILFTYTVRFLIITPTSWIKKQLTPEKSQCIHKSKKLLQKYLKNRVTITSDTEHKNEIANKTFHI